MQIFDSEMLPRKIPVSPSLCAVKARVPFRQKSSRAQWRREWRRPASRSFLMAELDFVSDKWAVARPDQA
jgi:hypothetical protein